MNLENYLVRETQNILHGQALMRLLLHIAEASQQIAQTVAQGGLAGATAKLSTMNVQGETQMQLDVHSHDLFIAQLAQSGVVAGAVSEELPEPYYFSTELPHAPFLVCFDPLDGSSNIAVNGIVGTIFSILSAPKAGVSATQDFLQPGSQQLAAGYILYGPATMLVLTIGHGTHGYTYNTRSQQYEVTHPNMTIPSDAREFAINASRQRFWEAPVQRYIADCLAGDKGPRMQNFNMRWMASMVADVHRILVRGGIFLYPKDNALPLKAGRLRLLYEANPMAYLLQQAGGKTSTGYVDILSIQPEEIHQRVPVILGEASEVDCVLAYHRDQG